MILTAHQPLYLPWAGLFAKVKAADQFVFFDTVQFEYHEFGNRNQIMTANGPLMITVPIEKKGHFDNRICDTKIANKMWIDKHLRTIRMAYGKYPFFNRYMPMLETILLREHELIADLNIDLTTWMMEELDCFRPWVRARDLEIEGKGSGLVLSMCLQQQADTYIFGEFGKDYADADAFEAAQVAVVFQHYEPITYATSRNRFAPGLSALDLLFNLGPAAAALI